MQYLTQRHFALFPTPVPTGSARGRVLWELKYVRGLRSWVVPHSYAYLRLSDDIQALQLKLIGMRRGINVAEDTRGDH